MIAPVLIDGLWQGAAIVAVAYAILLFVPRRNAATRYAVWLTALAALLFVPLATASGLLGAFLSAPQGAHAFGQWRIALVPVQPFATTNYAIPAAALRGFELFWAFGATIGLLRLVASALHIGVAFAATLVRRPMNATCCSPTLSPPRWRSASFTPRFCCRARSGKRSRSTTADAS